MNAFLSSVKADLLDVRLRLALIVLATALLAAVAYALFGGGASSTPVASTPIPLPSAIAGIAIEAPATPKDAVSETTNGSSSYAGAPWRNPFTPLPEPKAQTASASSKQATSASTASSSSGSGSSKSSSTSSGGGSAPAASKPSPSTPPKRVYIHYHVTAEFGLIGVLPAGAPRPKLKTYPNMALDEALPDKSNAQLLFAGVVLKTGDQVVFTLTGAAILHGSAVCVPSATQCQAIELKAGQSETLEVVEPSGAPATYELRVISIGRSASTASAARAHAASPRASHAVHRLLREARLVALPGLVSAESSGATSTAG